MTTRISPYLYNPVSPNGAPMCNNGFGVPILDYVGSDPNSNRSFNQNIGTAASGYPAGFSFYPGDSGSRFKQPYLHNMPHAFKILIEDEDFYKQDRPWNMWWLSGEHILQRVTGNFGHWNEEAELGPGQIVYAGVCAKYKYNKFVITDGSIVDPTDPTSSFTNPGLNTDGKITIYGDIGLPGDLSGDNTNQPLWFVSLRIGINPHLQDISDDVNNTQMNFPGEWQLWTSYNNYSYPINELDFQSQFLGYSCGYYCGSDLIPQDRGSPFRPGGMTTAMRPYEEVRFHRPVVNVGDSADALWWPSTIKCVPYHG